jgi:tetratricopeptide (TPR) repeat protein
VFLVPSFVVDYFVQRAADFLDWRSGLFRFPPDQRELLMDAERFALEGGYTEYLTLTNEARRKKILELKSLQEICPDSERKAKLLFEIGLLFFAEEDNENALTSWDKALDIKPDNHTTLFFRGIALDNLGRKKEAIASYDKGLEFNPGNHHHIWTLRGVALFALERYVEAIASYDKAIQFKPDDHETWHKRGLALTYLRLYQEALMSYDKALKIKPNFASAYYNKACCYGLQKNTDLAIETLKQAITLDSKYRELAKNDSDFDSIREDERFQALIKE